MADGLTMMERLERTGSFLPKGVAFAINQGYGLKFVTYADLKQQRIDKQRRHLEYVTSVREGRRAGFIWVFHQPHWIYHGWWLYLRVLGRGDIRIEPGIGYSFPDLARQAMEMFPCGIIPVADNFELWKEAFAAAYRRPGRFRKQGLAPVWINGDRLERAR